MGGSLTAASAAAYPCRVKASKAPLPSPDPPELALNAGMATALLTDFVRRETRKVGYSRVVIGLSGGVD